MEVAICGKTNVGKSTFFKSATLIDVAISARSFCTIKPNVGIAYVTDKCPCKELQIKCNPNNSKCVNGVRLIPVKLWDIAGLIPGAHEGKGLGNQFLNDIMRADVLINIVDASGTTDLEGNPTKGHYPGEDIKFLENEIDMWFTNVVKRNLKKIRDKNKAKDILSGLGIKEKQVQTVLQKVGMEPEEIAKELRKISKPIIIAANKMDLPDSEENLKKMKSDFSNLTIIPCSAEAEITLRTAEKNSFIEYVPGSSDFKITKDLSENQKKALNLIKENVLQKNGSTGVQDCLNKSIFNFLKYVAVYPVENEYKFSNKQGEILPDVFLMPPNSTALDLAYKVHTDIGEKFIAAINARTKKRVASDYVLKNGDIISIKASR